MRKAEHTLKAPQGQTPQEASAEVAGISDTVATQRRPWVEPAIDDLPKLTDLTLQSGGGIPGGEGVF